MSVETIQFPSASEKSKLSANPTTKIPQATDWIFQDFFNTMLEHHSFNNDKALAIPDVFPYEKLSAITQNHLFFDVFDKEDLMAPVLIESDISSEAPSSIMDTTLQQGPLTPDSSILTKRKSMSSFSSLKSFINVFHINKKYKEDVTLPTKYNTVPFPKKKSKSIKSTITRKFAKLLKVGFH